jgi:hypothetical protein
MRSSTHRTALEVAQSRTNQLGATGIPARPCGRGFHYQLVLESTCSPGSSCSDNSEIDRSMYTELGRNVKIVGGACGRCGPTMSAGGDGGPFGGPAATKAGQPGRRFWLKSDSCVLRSGDAFVPAGAVVGPGSGRCGTLVRLGGGCGGAGRLARYSPWRAGPHAEAAAPGFLSVR